MICKPCEEEKSEVCFIRLLSELNASVLQYEKLLLYICRRVCMGEYKDIASYSPRIFPGKTAFKPDCTLRKCKLSTLPPLCFFITRLPISCLLACWFSSLVSIRLAASRPSSARTKELQNWCICRKSLSKINGPLVSLPGAAFCFAISYLTSEMNRTFKCS